MDQDQQGFACLGTSLTAIECLGLEKAAVDGASSITDRITILIQTQKVVVVHNARSYPCLIAGVNMSVV
jgi:Asp/Glu/hydantoin racemase